MRGKILFATGLAVGYVLGSRAGRERYEQLKAVANSFWNDPRVQRRVDQVEDFVSDGAKKVVDQVTSMATTKKPAAKPAAKTPAKSTSAAKKKPASTSRSSGTSS